MGRSGLNAKLSYVDADGSSRSYRVRCSGVRHGVVPIFTESSARIRKVYYPHLSSLDKFTIDVEMISQREYISLANWLTDYVDWALQDDRYSGFPFMLVTVPSRRFIRTGVPIQGFEWGDKTGRMSWGITIAFETSEDITDWTGGQRAIGSTTEVSQAAGKPLTADVTKYFYPSGTQLSGSDAPDTGTYAVPITMDDINGGGTDHGQNSQPGSDIGVSVGDNLTRHGLGF